MELTPSELIDPTLDDLNLEMTEENLAGNWDDPYEDDLELEADNSQDILDPFDYYDEYPEDDPFEEATDTPSNPHWRASVIEALSDCIEDYLTFSTREELDALIDSLI